MPHEWALSAGNTALLPDQTGKLEHYIRLVREHNNRLNLVSAGDIRHLEERHIADSLSAVDVVACDGKTVVDIGSGAGLPGVVLAIAVPSASVICVERTRKRAAFIKLAARELLMENCAVEWADALDLCRDDRYASVADIVTMRAVAATGAALGLATGFLKGSGCVLLWQSHDQMQREPAPVGFSTTWYPAAEPYSSVRGIRVCRVVCQS